MIKILIALYADDNILCFNEDSGDAVFSCNNGEIFVCQKMRRKKKNQVVLSNAFNASVANNMKVLKHFGTKNYV